MNIKELAEQAGLPLIHGEFMTASQEKFAELVAAAEREQCAKHYLGIMRDVVTEAVAKECEASAQLMEEVGRQVAAAIRARGEKHD